VVAGLYAGCEHRNPKTQSQPSAVDQTIGCFCYAFPIYREHRRTIAPAFGHSKREGFSPTLPVDKADSNTAILPAFVFDFYDRELPDFRC
jgi:hypothetical protein